MSIKDGRRALEKSSRSRSACFQATLLLATSCSAPSGDVTGAETAPGAADDAPYVLVLGTAQDGGLPQIGCESVCCRTARSRPERRRLVTSLLLVDPRAGKRFLFDASPDLPEQVERCRGIPESRPLPGPRPPLFDGIFLTHAHMGHYTGLSFLGPEAYGARDVPLHVSERMAAYLSSNGPWSLLVEGGTLSPLVLRNGTPLALASDLSVTAIPVPHREEFTDTLAFVIRGPEKALLYLPDIDKWERWDTSIEDALAEVDHALLDGSFFGADEVPGRDLTEIPHPFICESISRFQELPEVERAKVIFTHLNHTNPAADPRSEEAAAVRAAGMRVAEEGERFDL